MDGGSDASATEAMVTVAILTEKDWGNATLAGGWQSTLADLVVNPMTYDADREKVRDRRELPLWESNRKGASL